MIACARHLAAAFLVACATLAALPARADEAVRAFFFGNSLIHHLTDTDETTVPHWLGLLAAAGGHDLRADGTWGFPQDFLQTLPPRAEWAFDTLQPVQAEGEGFAAAKFNTIVMNPANFIHYDPPDTPVGGNPDVIAMTADLFAWTAANAPGAVHYIYEGWSNMEDIADYPPTDRQMRRYHAFQQGDYHDWHLAYLDGVRAALPEVDIRLIPVASVLARVLSDGPLSDIPPQDIYSDISPHGTATKYLLAAMVVHAVIFNEPPPRIDLPATVHPVLRDQYGTVAAAIWAAVTGAVWPDGMEPATGDPADPAMGMGLAGIADWETQQPFIDLMKSARPWVAHTPDEWGAWTFEELQAAGYLDAEGWLRDLPPGVDRADTFILTEMPREARGLIGRYRVTWEGRGDIEVWGLVTRVDDRPTQISFDYAPGPGMVVLTLRAIDPADPIRNIRVVHEDLVPRLEAGDLFHPDWLRLVSGFRLLRFMDWMKTNHSTQSAWDARPRVSDFSYAWRGVPVEVMIDLANRAGADPWFNIPHMADDTYVRSFAEMVRDRLNPGLIAHVEWSNEVWNFQFGQSQWAIDQARSRWGTEEDGAWMQFAGLRAAEVMRIWTGVFGPDADARLLRIVGTQAGWMGLEEALLDAPLAQAEGLPPPHASFDAYAIAGYFGYELGAADTEGRLRRIMRRDDAVDAALDWVADGSLAELVDVIFPYHAAVAARYGLRLVAYEGGTHAVAHPPLNDDATVSDFLVAVNYARGMADLQARMLAGWRAAGGTLFTVFVDVQGPSRWGSWGTLRHPWDMTARWATVQAHNAAPVTWESRDPAVFAGQTP